MVNFAKILQKLSQKSLFGSLYLSLIGTTTKVRTTILAKFYKPIPQLVSCSSVEPKYVQEVRYSLQPCVHFLIKKSDPFKHLSLSLPFTSSKSKWIDEKSPSVPSVVEEQHRF